MPDIKSISEIFNNDEALLKVRTFLKNSDVVSNFNAVFPDLKKIAKAVKLEKNILYLRVENSVWRSELKLREKLIIDRLNKHYNENLIKAVKFIA